MCSSYKGVNLPIAQAEISRFAKYLAKNHTTELEASDAQAILELLGKSSLLWTAHTAALLLCLDNQIGGRHGGGDPMSERSSDLMLSVELRDQSGKIQTPEMEELEGPAQTFAMAAVTVTDLNLFVGRRYGLAFMTRCSCGSAFLPISEVPQAMERNRKWQLRRLGHDQAGRVHRAPLEYALRHGLMKQIDASLLQRSLDAARAFLGVEAEVELVT